MTITPMTAGDIPLFLELACGEGWISGTWEVTFLLAAFPEGCHAARDTSGRTAGFVTALRHGDSGWIGNLIVAPEKRGGGTGQRLFLAALDALRQARVKTVWLTASAAGRTIYERHGFRSIDRIIRMRGISGGCRRRAALPSASGEQPDIRALDRRSWGDRRELLLAALAARGRLFTLPSGFAILQQHDTICQLGPFAAENSSTAERLLDAATAGIPPGSMLYLDTPASNRTGRRLCRRHSMEAAGETELMYAGDRPAYQPELLYGLATMGSCG